MENAVNYVKVAACLGAAFAIGIGTLGPALGQGMVASKACENIGKYPESYANLRNALFTGLVFIETSSIYAFLIAVMLIFFV